MFDYQGKNFRGDLEILKNMIEQKKKFSFSKFADGEFHVLKNLGLNNGEFWFNPATHQKNRKMLIEAFRYVNDGYYVGVSCPYPACAACVSPKNDKTIHQWMKKNSLQPDSNLTWANIFVNSNYDYYLKNVVPLYEKFDQIYLVSNDKSDISRLPFNVKKHYKIGLNCWVNDVGLIDDIKKDIDARNIKDALFLFCCGPFGNILAHQLWHFSKNNTYIDIGSTLNPFLLGDPGKSTRGYLSGNKDRNVTCVWGD